MEKPITYGMVGGDVKAFIGEVHRKALSFDPRVKLVAGAFSIVPELHQLTAETYDIPLERRYDDYQQMAEKESKRKDPIDFVIVCTPNALHYEVCRTFLLQGINVICEKPLSFTPEEGEELVRLAKEKNLLFAVNYSYVGYLMVKIAKEMIQRGEIGEILSANAEYLQDWLLDAADPKTAKEAARTIWRLNPKMSGSSCCLGDIGTHCENMLHYLLGETPNRLFCESENYSQQLDLSAVVHLHFPSGIKASVIVSQVALGHENDFTVRIWGTQGSLEWHQQQPDYLYFTKRGERSEILTRGSSYLRGYEASQRLRRLPAGHPEGFYEAFANNYQAIVTSLILRRNGETLSPASEDYPHGEDGLEGVRFATSAVASNAGKCWVEMKQ